MTVTIQPRAGDSPAERQQPVRGVEQYGHDRDNDRQESKQDAPPAPQTSHVWILPFRYASILANPSGTEVKRTLKRSAPRQRVTLQ